MRKRSAGSITTSRPSETYAHRISSRKLSRSFESEKNWSRNTSASKLLRNVGVIRDVWSASPLLKGNVVETSRHGISNGGGRTASSSAMATSAHSSTESMSRDFQQFSPNE